MRLLRFARALKDDVVILRKCPWSAMTTYKGTNYFMNSWDMILVQQFINFMLMDTVYNNR
jgi:hypothetical protein